MKRILIIEDNREIALQMKKYLTNGGYAVNITSSYYEAIYNMNVDVDVAILDINLPDKDGHHLIKN